MFPDAVGYLEDKYVIAILFHSTVKLVLSGRSKLDKTKVLKTGGSLMQVESIAEGSFKAEHSAILLPSIKRLRS